MHQSDPLGRYPTPPWVALRLVEAMAGGDNPSCVVDLGVGAGALVMAALGRWPHARMVTVDVDPGATWPQAGARAHDVHVQADALDAWLPPGLGPIDAVLTNPPYLACALGARERTLLDDAGLGSWRPGGRTVPASTLFVAQALRLVRPGGQVGVVMPDALLSGQRLAGFRRALLEQHTLVKLLTLPAGVFARTEARAHLVVLTARRAHAGPVAREMVTRTGEVKPDQVLADPQLLGSWTAPGQNIGQPCLGDWLVRIERGQHAAAYHRRRQELACHTPDLRTDDGVVARALTLPAATPIEQGIARVGDILVARMGRGLEAGLARVVHGPVRVTDAVFIVRPRDGQEHQAWQVLASPEGRAYRARMAQGTGTRFLTLAMLRHMPLPQGNAPVDGRG